jgi:hypothetical protein
MDVEDDLHLSGRTTLGLRGDAEMAVLRLAGDTTAPRQELTGWQPLHGHYSAPAPGV